MVSLYLDNSGRIKKYYRKSINILEPKYVDQIYQNAEFFYQMKEFNDDWKLIRTKYYFRHKGLSLNNSIFSVIRNSFDEINLFTTSDNIFIDYVAFNDVMPNKQSLYFVDSRNHLIANSI